MEDLQDVLAVASAAAVRPRLATVGPAAVIVALTAFIVLSTVLTGTLSAVHLWSAAGLIVIIVVTAAVGLVVVRHQPRNPIGWLLAGEAIAAFAAHLKDSVDLDSVRTDLTAVVHSALEPARVSLWLTPRD